LLPRVEAMAGEGFVTGASVRNWASYAEEIVLGPTVTPAQKSLLTDPQTSGGLLVSCAPDMTDEVLSIFRSEGFDRAAVIGELRKGPTRVAVM
jgi:selenide, water dikinase